MTRGDSVLSVFLLLPFVLIVCLKSTFNGVSFFFFFMFRWCGLRQAERLKVGAVVITFTKGLPSPPFQLVYKKRFEMSWGKGEIAGRLDKYRNAPYDQHVALEIVSIL